MATDRQLSRFGEQMAIIFLHFSANAGSHHQCNHKGR
jgi:hypothetical protein